MYELLLHAARTFILLSRYALSLSTESGLCSLTTVELSLQLFEYKKKYMFRGFQIRLL
jgi:hypothetical protein